MKSLFARILAEWKFVLLPAFAKLGIWGAGALALLDSSTIPVPMDAYLALCIWQDKSRFWLYILMAAAGSSIGALLPYGLGRAGGELFLLKHVDRARLERWDGIAGFADDLDRGYAELTIRIAQYAANAV